MSTRTSALTEVRGLCTPNCSPTKNVWYILLVGELILFALLWSYSGQTVVPSPGESLSALQELFARFGLMEALWVSVKLNLEAIFIAMLITLALSYLSVVAIARPIIKAMTSFRFLSLVGLGYFFTQIFRGRDLKLAIEVFSITAFYLTSMLDVVDEIPAEKYDLARSLGFGPWRTVWEVVVLGRFDFALSTLRQNAAMGWMMLTAVESLVRSEGGIGALMVDQQKRLNMASVTAILIVLLITGMLQDQAIVLIRKELCPYADLNKERK